MDVLLHLLGANLIHAHFMFDWTFSSSRFVHATVEVRVDMTSISAQIGGSNTLDFNYTPPTTHLGEV